jgi:hypothetical protein
MKKYIVYFEGTVTEAEARRCLAGYCTIVSIDGIAARVQTDNPRRLELHLEQSPAVERYMEH